MTAPNDDDFALALDDYRTLYGDETRENLAKAASQRVLKVHRQSKVICGKVFSNPFSACAGHRRDVG